MLKFHKQVLDNGLTVIGEHSPRAQSVAVGYFVNTGSRDESADISGVSHFLEHMMFKGTARRSPEDINREFDELGANYNAYTNQERTVYYGAVLAERAPKLLDLLTDMMRPSLRSEDFDMEKNVILEEIAMYEDRPGFKVFERGGERFYGTHPLGNSILGTVESISALSRDQMQSYFEARYAPNNMILVLTGSYDWDTVLEQVKTSTQTWQAQESSRRYPDLEPSKGIEKQEDATLKRSHIALFAPGYSAKHELRYAAALVANCIGDSTGSRLYWSLIDKGLADSASLSHDSSDGLGAFVGYLSTAPEQLEHVLALYKDELLRAEKDGFSADEWQRAQRKLATSITLRSETPYGRLMSLGPSYLYTGEYKTVEKVIHAVFATTLDEGAKVLEASPFSNLFSMVISS